MAGTRTRLRNRKGQVVRFFTNGKPAQNAYGLFDQVERIVQRSQVVTQRTKAGLARRGPSFASQEIRADFNIRARDVTGKVTAATTGDTVRLFAFQSRIPLINFGGKWGGARTPGAVATIRKGHSETFTGSFIVALKGSGSREQAGQGRLQIRERRKVGGRRVWRGPLDILYGPSIADMFTGFQREPFRRSGIIGSYGTNVRERVLSRLQVFFVTELRRLYARESRRGQ